MLTPVLPSLTRYRVTYTRVGRHGGRDGSPVPAAITVEAVTAEQLLDQIAQDVRRYLGSPEYGLSYDQATGTGHIFAGLRTAGSFTVEALAPTTP
jgi:hypothetical protein